jgi:DNA-binding transcriptional LysR family regulator
MARQLVMGWGSSLDWDDFRYFSAVAHSGSVRGAATELGVNPSTVTRRLDALERHLGVLLFARTAHGLQITAEGSGVIGEVDAVADRLGAIESVLIGTDQRLAGCIRIAVPDVFAVRFLLADLAPFIAQYPEIDLQIIPAFQNLTLVPGQIDVAIYATDNPPQDMVGRPLNHIALAAYGSSVVLDGLGGVSATLADTGELAAAWVDWAAKGEVMAMYADLRERYFPNVHVQLRCDQVLMQHACLRAHMGVGILPCYLGDADATLLRLEHMPVQQGPTLWLLTHPDLRRTRRVQLLMEYVREVFVRRENELKGVIG